MAADTNVSDKDTVLDYLRNIQKASEIRANVEGVNLWVIAAALGIMTWQFIEIFDTRAWVNPESAIRLLLATQAVELFVTISNQARQIPSHLRFPSATPLGSPAVFAFLVILFILPSLYVNAKLEPSMLSIILTAYYSMAIGIFGLKAIKSLRPDTENRLKFPSEPIEASVTARRAFVIFFCFILLLGLIAEFKTIAFSWGGTEVIYIKNVILAVALYWLIVFALLQKQRNFANDWTYELETEIVLGLTTAEAAIRTIELRRLGPRLSTVTDEFFTEVVEKHGRLAAAIEQLQGDAEAIKDIPAEYKAERRARIEEASRSAYLELSSLIDAHEEYVSFAKRLIRHTDTLHKDRSKVIFKINEQHHEYFTRTKELRNRLVEIINDVTPEPKK